MTGIIIMAVVRVPALWKKQLGGLERIEVSSALLADALAEVAERHPGIRSHIYSETGEVLSSLHLFINDEHIRFRGGLAAPLGARDVIRIIPIISGGSD